MNSPLSFAALLFIASACSEPPPAFTPPRHRSPPAEIRFTPPDDLKSLRFGLIPYLEAETMRKTHQPLADYMTATLHVPVTMEVESTYADSIRRFDEGAYDVMELSPLSYARISTGRKVKCVAQSISDGSATGSGYIVVRDDSPHHTLDDLKGAKLGLVDPMSTTGSLFPRKLFKDHGIDGDFASVQYLGNHEAVLLAVLDGGVDVGATYQGSFAALWRSKAIDPLNFRVIAKTPRVPRDIYCVREGLPNEVEEAFTAALLQLSTRDHAGRQILGPLNLNGFIPPNDVLYEPVRNLARELNP